MDIHHAGLRQSLADRGRHGQLENKNGDKIEDGCKQHGLPRLQNTR